MKTEKKSITIYINEQLWKDFSKKCIDEDEKRSELLERLINKYLEK
jgi:hypothetical protein